MKTRLFSQNLCRLALMLATAMGLALPLRSFSTSGPSQVLAVARGGPTMTSSIDAVFGRRLDVVAASLLTRPVESLTSAERRELVDRYSDQIIASNTDLEAFARSADFAAVLSGGDVDEFVMTLSYLSLDATNNWTAIAAGPMTRLRQRIHNALPWFPGSEALLRYGSQGFAVDDKSNQAQHFWYSVAITYKWGEGVAEVIARYHEWNPPALLRWLPGTGKGNGSAFDLGLSHQGMALGRMLRDGSIRPEGVGEWMLEELG